jgi:hypothetical protein
MKHKGAICDLAHGFMTVARAAQKKSRPHMQYVENTRRTIFASGKKGRLSARGTRLRTGNLSKTASD